MDLLAISFKRHEENPLDSLGIGRIMERKRESFEKVVDKTISDIIDLIKDYPEARYVGWDPLYNTDPGIQEPFFGFKIRLKISTFPFPSIEKVYDCNFEYYMETEISRLRWYLKPGVEEIDKFGDIEECKFAFKEWLNEYCLRKNDQRRFKFIWM